MNAFVYRNLADTMYCLRTDSGGSVDYKKGTLVAVYAILTGFHSQKFVEKLICEYLPKYIEKGVIPESWSTFIDLYEEYSSDCDGTIILKKKK